MLAGFNVIIYDKSEPSLTRFSRSGVKHTHLHGLQIHVRGQNWWLPIEIVVCFEKKGARYTDT